MPELAHNAPHHISAPRPRGRVSCSLPLCGPGTWLLVRITTGAETCSSLPSALTFVLVSLILSGFFQEGVLRAPSRTSDRRPLCSTAPPFKGWTDPGGSGVCAGCVRRREGAVVSFAWFVKGMRVSQPSCRLALRPLLQSTD